MASNFSTYLNARSVFRKVANWPRLRPLPPRQPINSPAKKMHALQHFTGSRLRNITPVPVSVAVTESATATFPCRCDKIKSCPCLRQKFTRRYLKALERVRAERCRECNVGRVASAGN